MQLIVHCHYETTHARQQPELGCICSI